MFYTYKDFISTSYAHVAKKKDTLGKRPGNESFQIETHNDAPIGDYRWLGTKPEVKQEGKPAPHSKEFVIAYFEANGGTQQGAKDNWIVKIGEVAYTVKKFDGQVTVTLRKEESSFPITGIQAGSEL